MIPLTTVSERITEHIRAGSECGKGYSAVLIRLLILSTAQLLCQSGSSFIFSGHLLPSLRLIPGNFFCSAHSWRQWGNKEGKRLRWHIWAGLFDETVNMHSVPESFGHLKKKWDTWAVCGGRGGGRWRLRGQLSEAGINSARERQSSCFLDICK